MKYRGNTNIFFLYILQSCVVKL